MNRLRCRTRTTLGVAFNYEGIQLGVWKESNTCHYFDIFLADRRKVETTKIYIPTLRTGIFKTASTREHYIGNLANPLKLGYGCQLLPKKNMWDDIGEFR